MSRGTGTVNSIVHPLELLLRKLEAYAAIPRDERRVLLALPYRLATIEPQGFIVRPGDCPGQTGILLSGFAFQQKVTAQGTRQIVALHIPGDPIDLQNLFVDDSDHAVQALTRAQVALVPRDRMQQLVIANPALARAVFVATQIEAAIYREWIVNIGRRDARSRLAHLLCEWIVRLRSQGLADEAGDDLPMTQEQLADTLGLTPVHVNRMLKSLEEDGLVARDRKRLRFPDSRRLLEITKFDARYLHLQKQSALAA
jgi:CRP-like cAMP-binding protein